MGGDTPRPGRGLCPLHPLALVRSGSEQGYIPQPGRGQSPPAPLCLCDSGQSQDKEDHEYCLKGREKWQKKIFAPGVFLITAPQGQ